MNEGRKKYTPGERVERRGERHILIQEFRDSLSLEKFTPVLNTEGVVVHSASRFGIWNKLEMQEDVARIAYGIHMIRTIVARKLEKEENGVTHEDIITLGPPLILDGATEQLPAMEAIALEHNFPKEKLVLVDCGEHAKANTRTQVEAIVSDPRYQSAKHLTFVTTSYHVPRVTRTVDKQLPPDMDFQIVGIPLKNFPFCVTEKVFGEMKRIHQYSIKGDIERQKPKRGNT